MTSSAESFLLKRRQDRPAVRTADSSDEEELASEEEENEGMGNNGDYYEDHL